MTTSLSPLFQAELFCKYVFEVSQLTPKGFPRCGLSFFQVQNLQRYWKFVKIPVK